MSGEHPLLQPGQSLPAFIGAHDEITVVLFFRGPWCPVCRRHLARIDEHREEWRGLGASIVAVSSSPLSNSEPDISLQELDITFVLDTDALEIARLGLAHEHQDHGAISRPATLIADRHGIIQYAHIGVHARDRPEPEAILLAVQRLAEESGT